MKTLFRRLSAALLLWAVAFVPLARAHDPLQAWATATVKPDGLEINMVLSSYPSQTLIDKELKRPPLIPENFDTYKSELESAALGLFDITDGGQPLKALSATVELTEESDIQYLILYPAPHIGPLHFRITYLDRILEGFVTTLFVEDKAGQSLAWDELSTDKDWLDAPLPSAAAPAKPPSVPAASAPTAATGAPVAAASPTPLASATTASASHGLSAKVGAVFLLLLAAGSAAFVLLRHRRGSRS